MLFNVYDYSNQVIGQVEASDAVEAWSEAGKRFEYILDVREVEEPKYGEEEERQYKEEEHYREKGFRIVHAKVGEPKSIPVILKLSSELGPYLFIYNIIYKGENVGALEIFIPKGIRDSLVVDTLTVNRPGIVSRDFLSLLCSELENIAKVNGLRKLKVVYYPWSKGMYELVGFTQSFEKDEEDMVVKYIG